MLLQNNLQAFSHYHIAKKFRSIRCMSVGESYLPFKSSKYTAQFTNLHGWVFCIWCYSSCKLNRCDAKAPYISFVVITVNLEAKEHRESKTKLSRGGGGRSREWRYQVPHISNIMTTKTTNPPDFSKHLHATGNNVMTSLSLTN